MYRFTDKDFKLPSVIAVTAQDILSGTTQPIIISGISNIYKTLDYYVVKPKGNGRMVGAASMREFLASFIAIELGLNLPAPAIIQVSNEFIESTRFTDNYQRFNNSSGNNFGSKYVEGFINITQDFSVFKKYYSDLQKILIFDIFISTSDRRINKPNMALYEGSVYIYDHELSFSFVHDIFANHKPWKITKEDRVSIEGHILFNFFRTKKIECENFIDNFILLNDHFWNKAYSFIPSDIIDQEQFLKIKNNLTSKIDKLDLYREEIKKVLL